METPSELAFSCPVKKNQYDHVLLAHGGGGTLMQNLIASVFLPAFSNPLLNQQHDAAVIDLGGTQVAFTTDSYVVQPLFFPGGDIGSLAVHGTVNDLAMSGAKPLALSLGLILEEGFPIAELKRITASIQAAASRCGVVIATGDTKVVNKGKGDGVYINTSGIGIVPEGVLIHPRQVQPGDVVLVNGDIGRHGMAIMTVREGLEFESAIESDSAPVSDLVGQLLAAPVAIHCLRDCTRGGVAASLNEIAASRRLQIELMEESIPVRPDVEAACEILGFDPLYVANEGRFVAFLPEKEADKALAILHAHPQGQGARVIGVVRDASQPLVTMQSALGSTRILDQLSGEQLPRIC